MISFILFLLILYLLATFVCSCLLVCLPGIYVWYGAKQAMILSSTGDHSLIVTEPDDNGYCTFATVLTRNLYPMNPPLIRTREHLKYIFSFKGNTMFIAPNSNKGE